MTYLLDVNAILGCIWERHSQWANAQQYFFDHPKTQVATCPLGEIGALRIMMLPQYGNMSPTDAWRHLDRLTSFQHFQLDFWMDEIRPQRRPLKHHADLVDQYLADLAHKKGGKLLTFDGTIQSTHVFNPLK